MSWRNFMYIVKAATLCDPIRALGKVQAIRSICHDGVNYFPVHFCLSFS